MGLQGSTFELGVRPEALLLVEEITHRVLNEYAEAIAIVRLAAASVTDSPSAAALASVAARLRAHAEAHRALHAPTFEGPTDLGDYIARLCSCLAKTQSESNGVRLVVSADEIWLDAGRCWRVGLIIAELVRNAIKHGLSGGQGVIRVDIAETSGWISCEVWNDGGRGSATEAGRGRRLVQSLAAEIDGAVEWRFTPLGCRALLVFERPDPSTGAKTIVSGIPRSNGA